MKHLILSAILWLFIVVEVFSQNISVTFTNESESLSPNSYYTQNSVLTINNSAYRFGEAQVLSPVSWHISKAKNKLSFVEQQNGLTISSFDDNGRTLFKKELPFFNMGDETINNYQFNDGRIVLRDNVANFNFFNPKGEVLYSISNSSQSSSGERESELAADYTGSTLILFNPVISYGNTTGSRATLIFGENDSADFFRNRDREISYLNVSDSGTFITLIASGMNDDLVLLYDRFGNKIFETRSDDDLVGAIPTEDAAYITVYSSGRVQVIDVMNDEVLGSASSRSSIIKADYQPDENLIMALVGNRSGNLISDPEITVVDLERRQILRETISASELSFYTTDQISFMKKGPGEITLHGLNKDLIIRLN